jgi:hypothetical protein
MKIIFTTLCLLAAPVSFVFSQSQGEKEKVMKPVKQLFEAMQKGDSAMLRTAFTKQ